MDIKSFFSILSGIVFLYAFYPYWKAILRGETKPQKVTWLIWAISDGVILAGMLANDTINGLLVGAVISATITFILALKFGKSGWNRQDKVCLTLSILAILLWVFSGESNVGIALSLLVIVIGMWPTWVSTLENPAHESKKGWAIFLISSFLAMVAITNRTFADVAPPSVFFTLDLSMVYLLFIHPVFKRIAVNHVK